MPIFVLGVNGESIYPRGQKQAQSPILWGGGFIVLGMELLE